MNRTLSICVLLAAGCSTPEVGVYPRVGPINVDGELSVTTGAVTGTAGDGALDLDRETTFQPKLDLRWERFGVSIDATALSVTGSGAVETTVAPPSGDPVTTTVPVRSAWDFGLYTARAAYDLVPAEAVSLDVGAGGAFLSYEVDIRAVDGGASVASDQDVTFAYVFARAGYTVGRVEWFLMSAGAAAELESEDVSYVDLEAGGEYRWGGRNRPLLGALAFGFRRLDIDYQYEDRGAEVDAGSVFEGPYVGLAVSF